jgi:hypothetical protein
MKFAIHEEGMPRRFMSERRKRSTLMGSRAMKSQILHGIVCREVDHYSFREGRLLNNLRHFLFLSVLLFLLSASLAVAASNTTFECGGEVEDKIWASWDGRMRDYLQRRLLQERLLKKGDGDALYDFQTYTHNLVSMAQRCNRKKRLSEIAKLISTAYEALEPGTQFSPGRRWICRSGGRCDHNERLHNTEVMLNSVQFLGIASSVANALVTSNAPLNDEDRLFVRDTLRIATEHLLRWGDGAAIGRIQKAMEAKPQDIKNGSSSLFFGDKHLWMITIYAELAGIIDTKQRRDSVAIALSEAENTHLKRHFGNLLQFFSARISFQRTANDRSGNAKLADLDRGYWRLYDDNSYAGYENDEKPVVCERAENGKSDVQLTVRIPPDAVPKRQDTGWDISHARRLVPALDSLQRNRKAIQRTFLLDDAQLPASELTSAFANTLVSVIWNGDKDRPLFSNYWSGANGWFRVAYGRARGKCREGYPPYGMTGSFLTGGYITWARNKPIIGVLGRRFYELTSSPDDDALQFIVKYYPDWGPAANAEKKALMNMMFLPSLVGIAGRQKH